jgi:hypothetical protein
MTSSFLDAMILDAKAEIFANWTSEEWESSQFSHQRSVHTGELGCVVLEKRSSGTMD